jgi:hypothetical protein
MIRLHGSPRSVKCVLVSGLLLALLAAIPVPAKTTVDFDPNIDFSKYKTFVFLGGVEHLVMVPVSLDLIELRVHHAVTRELTKKGLREVQPGEHPDLAVRYWENASKEVNISVLGNWGPYRPYIDSYWSSVYNEVSVSSAREGALIIDLIDAKSKELAWRLYLMHKITAPDKEWKKADDELSKGFESYPPSEKEVEERKRERAAHPPKAD